MPTDTDTTITELLEGVRRIAVVGLSSDPMRESHGVAVALQGLGYEIVPVNPNVDEVLGEPAYATLADVPGEVDLVNVFRRREHLVEVARDAAAVGAPALWNQIGLRSDEARRIAEEADMTYVEDRCLKVEVRRRGARPA